MDNKIKSIVISGGGHTFVTFYGILKESREQNFWNIENIDPIMGLVSMLTLAGVATIISSLFIKSVQPNN